MPWSITLSVGEVEGKEKQGSSRTEFMSIKHGRRPNRPIKQLAQERKPLKMINLRAEKNTKK